MMGDRELRFTFIYWFAQNRLPEGRVLRSWRHRHGSKGNQERNSSEPWHARDRQRGAAARKIGRKPKLRSRGERGVKERVATSAMASQIYDATCRFQCL